MKLPRLNLALFVTSLAFVSAYSPAAAAQEPGIRKGGQMDFMLGVSGCLPGPKGCKTGNANSSGALVGFAANLGYRIHRHFLLGAGYSLGFFGPEAPARRALQNSVVAVIRGYLPAWRFDFGFELSPGWSRVSTQIDKNNGSYSQGFALRPGVTADFWLGDRVFLGLAWMTTLNFHNQVCNRAAATTTCGRKSATQPASGHQFMTGIHIGGTF